MAGLRVWNELDLETKGFTNELRLEDRPRGAVGKDSAVLKDENFFRISRRKIQVMQNYEDTDPARGNAAHNLHHPMLVN